DADSVVYFSRENNAWAKKGAIQTGTSSHALAFTQDGKTLYVTNQGNATVSILNAETKTKIKDLIVGTKPNGIVLKQ
ncbi:MAG: YncE family protein, partial [Bacteroidia bacterium]